MKPLVCLGASLCVLLAAHSAWSREAGNDALDRSAIWTGERIGPSNTRQEIQLFVRDHARGIFQGEIVFVREDGKSEAYPVEGITAGSAIRFMTERHGSLQLFFAGRLEGDAFVLTYSGKNRLGQRTSGRATLRAMEE